MKFGTVLTKMETRTS